MGFRGCARGGVFCITFEAAKAVVCLPVSTSLLTLCLLWQIGLGVLAAIGAVVLYKVIKNDDSVEGAAKDVKGSIKGGFKGVVAASCLQHCVHLVSTSRAQCCILACKAANVSCEEVLL